MIRALAQRKRYLETGEGAQTPRLRNQAIIRSRDLKHSVLLKHNADGQIDDLAASVSSHVGMYSTYCLHLAELPSHFRWFCDAHELPASCST